MSVGSAERGFEVYQDGREVCVVLKGRVVLEELDAVKQGVLPRITRGTDHVYVDLKHVEYVDSAGLGLLIGFKMTSKMNGAGISLMDPNKTVSDVLNISKIDGIFEFLNGREAQGVRDRLVVSEKQCSGTNMPVVDSSPQLPQVKSDGSLEEDAGATQREQLEEHCRRAVEAMRQGNYEDSVTCYKQALEIDPDYLPALNNLAIVYEKQPVWHDSAIETWNRVLELSRERGDDKHRDRAERHLADLGK